MDVSETFFSLAVAEMARGARFYVTAFGAQVLFRSPDWSSLRIAGVRLGLARVAGHGGERVGLHFAVGDLARACADVAAAGGQIASSPREISPGVRVAEVRDTEGNTLSLNERG
jgi:predicted enzyme related to lactoylglutathione lyase